MTKASSLHDEELSEPLLSSEEVCRDERLLVEDPWKNRNVRLNLLLCAMMGVADSIWSYVVLSGFLFALGDAMGMPKEDNTLVGFAEAVQGMSQLIFALPIGLLADKYGKARIVRYGGTLMLLTIAVTLAALLVVRQHALHSAKAANRSYLVFVVALALWGVVGGIVNGPSQALFADSIPNGQRSELLAYLYASYLLSSAVGPALSIVLLYYYTPAHDEDWGIPQIFPVFFVGIILEIPSAIALFFFSEKHVVSPDKHATLTTTDPPPQQKQQQQHGSSLLSSKTTSMTKKAVPYVLFLSSLIICLGSGASVKYFPLFFKQLGLSSIAVQFVYLIMPLSISMFSFVAQRISKSFGRIETTVLLDVIGVTLLLLMTWLSNTNDYNDVHNSFGNSDHDTVVVMDRKRVMAIVAVYLLRTGIMNSTYPLLESILMDSVPSNQRARWKSLESVASFGWTGSALAGGILSDTHSYQFTFGITAILQLAGSLFLLSIQPFVEAETSSYDSTTTTTTTTNSTSHPPDDYDATKLAILENDDTTWSEPLLLSPLEVNVAQSERT